MRRMALAVATLLACCAPSARADTLPLVQTLPIFDGLPGEYTPGTPFTFEVRIPQLAGFTSYTLELVFSTPDVSVPLLTASALASTSHYPFPTANIHPDVFVDEETNQLHLLFSDSTSPGVVARPGVNDTLVTVTVVPDAALRGPIQFGLGPLTDFEHSLEDPEYPPFPPAEEPIEIAQGGGAGNLIPAPPGVLLAGVGALLLATRSRFRAGSP